MPEPLVGGDGRSCNRCVVQTVVRMAAANAFGRIIIGRQGLSSTRAAFKLIRKRTAFGGPILERHRKFLGSGDFRMQFDVMHAATGPYARGILEDRLGA